MSRKVRQFARLILMAGVAAGLCAGASKEKIAIAGPGSFWREPHDISSRDLFYGPGGRAHQPRGPYRFLSEDQAGSNPKINVIDAGGVKWKVKMGQEARPETAASRLVWSVGFFTSEDYLVRDFKVEGLPAHLKRGSKLVGPGGAIACARFKRMPDGEKKIGIWDWRDPLWAHNRDANGLKAVMALINNWDLKPENNAVYQRDDERIFLVSDLGASFGTPGRSWPEYKAKDDLAEYEKSTFIRNLRGDAVDFQTPARPRFVFVVSLPEYLKRVHLESIGKHVPLADARWVGQLLARLSPRQIRDAFRAAGYSESDADRFTQIVLKRIAALTDL